MVKTRKYKQYGKGECNGLKVTQCKDDSDCKWDKCGTKRNKCCDNNSLGVPNNRARASSRKSKTNSRSSPARSRKSKTNSRTSPARSRATTASGDQGLFTLTTTTTKKGGLPSKDIGLGDYTEWKMEYDCPTATTSKSVMQNVTVTIDIKENDEDIPFSDIKQNMPLWVHLDFSGSDDASPGKRVAQYTELFDFIRVGGVPPKNKKNKRKKIEGPRGAEDMFPVQPWIYSGREGGKPSYNSGYQHQGTVIYSVEGVCFQVNYNGANKTLELGKFAPAGDLPGRNGHVDHSHALNGFTGRGVRYHITNQEITKIELKGSNDRWVNFDGTNEPTVESLVLV